MERRKFIKSGTLAITGLLLHTQVSAMTTATPQIFYFKVFRKKPFELKTKLL